MLDFEGYVANNSLFAAANSYLGFKSEFDKIMFRDSLEHLFILKGGPGTGKSSIMKAVIKYANREGIYAEAIWCSSDPNSLDGVILTDGDKSVAIADGTAPHTMDQIYPGARDEIINLGESFNIKHLKKYSDKIQEISQRKAYCYSTAYKYLALAGKVHSFIKDKYYECLDKEKLDKLVNSIIKSFDRSFSCENTRCYYISAFCKDGYLRTEYAGYDSKKATRLCGDGYTEYFVMQELIKSLSGYIEAYCPTPFTDEDIEAIYTPRELFIIDGKNDGGIDTSVVLRTPPRLESEQMIYNELLTLSKNSFSKASEFHFQLEDIYKHGIDFQNNEKIFSKLIRDIERELS